MRDRNRCKNWVRWWHRLHKLTLTSFLAVFAPSRVCLLASSAISLRHGRVVGAGRRHYLSQCAVGLEFQLVVGLRADGVALTSVRKGQGQGQGQGHGQQRVSGTPCDESKDIPTRLTAMFAPSQPTKRPLGAITTRLAATFARTCVIVCGSTTGFHTTLATQYVV